MSDVIDISVRDTGTPVVVRNFMDIATAAGAAAKQVDVLKSVMQALGRSKAAVNNIAGMGTASQAAAAQVLGLNNALNQLGNTRNGLGNLRNGIGGVGNAASSAVPQLNLMQTALAGIAAALSVDKLMDYADAWNSAAGLIRTATKDQNEATVVTQKVYEAAQRSRMELGSMADLYTRVARAGRDLGASQGQVIGFAEGVGKALAIQHTTAQQASGALIQLGQALSMGRIRAQEWNSLLQNGQVILQTVAKHIDGTGGSVARLDQMVKKGKVSSKEFFDAFMKGLPDLDQEFQKTSFLFSQGWTVLKNGISKYLGEMDQALGTSKAFVSIVQWMTQNMPIVAGAVAGLGTAIAIAFSPIILAKFMQTLQATWALLAANPFALVLAAIAGVIVALTFMRDSISLGVDKVTTLGDLMRAMWEDISSVISNVAGFFGSLWESMTSGSRTAAQNVVKNNREAAAASTSAYADFYANTGNGLAGWLTAVAKTADAILGFLGGAALAAGRAFMQFFSFMYNELAKLQNKAAEFAEGFINNMIDASNKMREALGMNPLEHVQIAKAKVEGADQFKSLGQIWAESMDDAFKTTDAVGINQWLQDRIKRAQEIAKTSHTGLPGGVNLSDPIDPNSGNLPGTDPKAEKALKRLKESLADVIAEISPAERALKRLADAQNVLDAAVKAHLITQTEAKDIMEKLKQRYEDVIHPLQAMNREMDRHIATLQMSNREAQVEEELYGRTEELKRKGVYLTQAETAALRDKIVVEQELTRIARQRDQLEQGTSQGKMLEFVDQLKALQQMMQAGTMGEGDKADILSKMLPWADLSGTQEQMAAYVQAHADMYAQIKQLEDASVISADTAARLRAQADLKYNAMRLQGASAFFSTLAQLSSSSNKKLAAIGKAAAIAQATIDGYLAVQKAYTTVPYPYNIPAAIAQGVLAAANIANIVNTQTPGFRTGGSMVVGGSGGDDSQLVAFRATPGERIQVNTPSQARAIEQGGGNGAPPEVNVHVVNVDDPQRYIDALDTREGARVVLNHMQSDPESFRRALGIT